MATDPLTRQLGDDNQRLRELLELVAKDLEAIASKEEYAAHTVPLQRRAMRIRARRRDGA
jgi:hypothetical protein